MIHTERTLAYGFFQQLLRVGGRCGGASLGEFTCGKRENCLGIAFDVVVPAHHRQETQAGHDDQEKDDQGRDQSTQDRFGGQQLAVGWAGEKG